jgi:anthranilate phosphoribosyltransferase
MKTLLERVLDGGDLSAVEAGTVMEALTDKDLPPAVGGALLGALRTKGETSEEVRGFADAMRRLAVSVHVPLQGPPVVDTCGTGGDGSGSLNLSTAAGLIAAAAGVRVVKHGNRSISSRAGSADVLETLGVPISLGPEEATQCLVAHSFVFLFAPRYHPAMAAVMPVRRAMGVRTVFNMLGPLSNPAAPNHQVVGAFSLAAAEKMAHAMSGMDLTRAFVVHGVNGWDEATPIGPYHLFDVRPGRVDHTQRDPLDVGIGRCAPTDLAGDDAAYNATALEALLRGAPGPHQEAACLSAGLALEVTGMVENHAAGIECARAAINDGSTGRLLDGLRGTS